MVPDDSAIVRMLQAVVVPVIGSACHVFMHGLNHVKIYGAEKLHQALLERPKGKPLLTGMDMALSKLNSGGWVHIFPEGSRSKDGGKTISSAKRGVGRLVMDADSVPVVIPFVHAGMQEIMPVGTKLPKVGKQVTVVVGDPIYLDDLLISKDTAQDNSRGILYDAVSWRIGHHLQDLKVQAEKLALEQRFELGQYHMKDGEHGYGIWQQVDWEAFGMENVMSSSSSDGSQIVKQAPVNRPMEEQSLMPNSTQSTTRAGFTYEGGIMSRVCYYVNPSEFMGFAAKGLFMNSRLLDEGLDRSNVQEARPVRAWKQFVNERLSDEDRFDIQEAGPVRAWKQFMKERFLDEGCFSIQEAGSVKAWKQFINERKQFFEGSVYRPYNSV